MFDFEKLVTYQKAKTFNKKVIDFLSVNRNLDRATHDQLRRASLSIMLNIAEGSGRFSNADRSNFYIIARGSLYECVAIFDYLNDKHLIDNEIYNDFYSMAEEISKMIFGMIKNLKSV